MLRSQKGISGIDITVSIILITIFMTLAVMASGRIVQNRNRSSVNRQALVYAINEIERLKQMSVEDNSLNNIQGQYIGDTSFYQTVIIEDYKEIADPNNLDSSIVEDKLKKATVEIKYKEAGTIKTIELSAVIY